MENSALLGPAAPEHGWVPAPRYLLRRDRILRALEGVAPSRILEIGCGSGMLLHELAARGHECHGLETSEVARPLAERLASLAGLPITFHQQPQADWAGQFDVVLAFEVLEHIEDDQTALTQWQAWLKPGGRMLLSVPAHKARWNPRDVWAGHVRRYERSELVQKFAAAGFQAERIECYGFPLANVLERGRAPAFARTVRARQESTESTRANNTALSGVDRGLEVKLYPLLRSLPGRLALSVAIQMQRPFLDTEWGNGYLVLAQTA